MSDVKCVVCGEPWDYMGARHGCDMLKWEYALFRKGAGCPSCKGVVEDSERFHPETIDDVEFGDEDPILRIHAYENSIANPIPWERPKDPVLWKCDGCDVEVIRDVDDGTLRYRAQGRGKQWYISHDYDDRDVEETPAHVFGEQKVCPYCLEHCEECGTPISHTLSFDDSYDDGYCFHDGGGRNFYCVEHIPDENGE